VLSDRPLPDETARAFIALPGRFEFIGADVRDASMLAAVMRDHGIARVVHGAAITPDQRREAAIPSLVLEVNLVGLVRLLEAARDVHVERIVLVSSAAAYGHRLWEAELLDEAADGSPDTLYAISKAAAEQTLWRLGDLYGLSCIAGRLGAVFGPWERASGWRDTLSPILQVTRLARAGAAAVLPQEDRRDWMYSRDAASALLRLLDAPKPRHRLYNLGSGFSWSLGDWCRRLTKRYPDFAWTVGGAATGIPIQCHTRGTPAALVNTRFADEHGPPATHDLDRAFEDYLHWLDSTDEHGSPFE
jgi:nucleoside-diphosphate-sugar epimerase